MSMQGEGSGIVFNPTKGVKVETVKAAKSAKCLFCHGLAQIGMIMHQCQ